jgi:hypothetical protein
MRILYSLLTTIALSGGVLVLAQPFPGAPETNGLPPKTGTIYINKQNIINNGNTESLGVAIARNGNALVGWGDDGDNLADLEAVWMLFDPGTNSITPITRITSLQPQFAGQVLSNNYLSYFRADGSAVPGRTSWGSKSKANLFGEGIGMGATSFELGAEVPELASLQIEAGGVRVISRRCSC